MASFDNQYNFRVDNQLKVLSRLRNGPVSLNDLASHLNVSFTAVIKITDQLLSEGVIVYSKKPLSKKKGRKPTYVQINNKAGVTIAIDLSDEEIVVALCSVDHHFLVIKNIQTKFFLDESSLEEITVCIKELLASREADGRPLLGICIGAPGMINKNTGEFADSFRLQKLANVSISNFFFNRLGVHTNVYHDVNIGMVGERLFGCIPLNAQNYMFAHIGRGCGLALSFNGSLYQGSNGYCGELSNYYGNEWLNPVITNNHLEDLSNISARIEKKHPEIKLTNAEYSVDKNKFFKEFEARNPYVLAEIEQNAKINAIQFIAYNDLLDLEYIIIAGSILKLGDYYKDLFFKYLKQYSLKPFRAKFLFSNPDFNPTLTGAMYQANNLYFLRKLEQITNKKSSAIKYDISEAFGNNI